MPEIVGRLRSPRLATAPSSPALGEMYYDTATSQLKWWNGTAWQVASGGSALPADTVIVAGTRIIANKLLAGDAQPAYRFFGDGKQEWGPGGSTVPDTNLFRFAANFLGTQDDFVARQGDAGQISLQSVGSQPVIFFGSAQDTNLYRQAAGRLVTDTDFYARKVVTTSGGVWAQVAAGVVGFGTYRSGDAYDRWEALDDGTLKWGPGNAATDVTLYRNAGGSLSLAGQLVVRDRIFTGGPGTGGIWVDGGTAHFIGSGAASWLGLYNGNWGLQLYTNGVVIAGGLALGGQSAPGSGLKFGDNTVQTTAWTSAEGGVPARLGATAVNIGDWNNATTDGYYSSGSVPNAPIQGYWLSGHVTTLSGAAGVIQTVWMRDGKAMWVRSYNGSAWGAWYQIYPIDNGGLPLRLSNSNAIVNDWNNAVTSGWYLGQDAANSPPVVAGTGYKYLLTLVISWDGSANAIQVAYPIYYDEIWMRRQNNTSTWSTWVRVYPVSDAALPTRLGTVGKTITDWNAAIENGWYMANGATNAPPSGSGWMLGQVFVHNPSWVTQEVWDFAGSTSPIHYRRQQNNGTWYAWEQIYPPAAGSITAAMQANGTYPVTGTTAASLGTGVAGKTGLVSFPNGDKVLFVWDSTLGKWVSPHIVLVSNSVDGLVANGGGLNCGFGWTPWSQYWSAGFRPQVRVIGEIYTDDPNGVSGSSITLNLYVNEGGSGNDIIQAIAGPIAVMTWTGTPAGGSWQTINELGWYTPPAPGQNRTYLRLYCACVCNWYAGGSHNVSVRLSMYVRWINA